MSVETKFRCDVCKSNIKDDALAKNKAFALRWKNNCKLETSAPWRDMPLHICVACIEAIVEFNLLRVNR